MSSRFNSYLSSCIFFYRYVDHRDLHSFPTRRSSDLWVAPGWGAGTSSSFRTDGPPYSETRIAFMTMAPFRSEEHTSELQSPVHLVCRLLLEKKKTSSINSSFIKIIFLLIRNILKCKL